MTEKNCAVLEQTPGIVNAYSWPTGMRNDGPIEYAVYYDDTELTQNTVERTIQSVINLDTPGVHISTTTHDQTDVNRPNEATDPENKTLPLITAREYRHNIAAPLTSTLESTSDIESFHMDWDPAATGSEWDTETFLTENPTSGRLNVFFEAKELNAYDEILDVIHESLVEITKNEFTMNVVQADRDGYYISIACP